MFFFHHHHHILLHRSEQKVSGGSFSRPEPKSVSPNPKSDLKRKSSPKIRLDLQIGYGYYSNTVEIKLVITDL